MICHFVPLDEMSTNLQKLFAAHASDASYSASKCQNRNYNLAYNFVYIWAAKMILIPLDSAQRAALNDISIDFFLPIKNFFSPQKKFFCHKKFFLPTHFFDPLIVFFTIKKVSDFFSTKKLYFVIKFFRPFRFLVAVFRVRVWGDSTMAEGSA